MKNLLNEAIVSGKTPLKMSRAEKKRRTLEHNAQYIADIRAMVKRGYRYDIISSVLTANGIKDVDGNDYTLQTVSAAMLFYNKHVTAVRFGRETAVQIAAPVIFAETAKSVEQIVDNYLKR